MLITSNTYCFPRPKWLRERASMLRYTYIACLVRTKFHSLALLYMTLPTTSSII